MELRSRCGRVLAAAAAVAVVMAVLMPAYPASAAGATYTLVDLGKIGQRTFAVSINGRSDVVGNFFDPDRGWGSFLWSPSRTGGTMVELPGLPCPGCETLSVNAVAIDNRGDIVGEAAAPDGSHVVMWIGGTIRDMGTYGAGVTVTAMNNRHQIVGYTLTAAGQWHVVVWSPGTGWRDISPGFAWARAYDINDRGQVAGECGDTTETAAACLWQPDGTVQNVAGLPGYTARATAVNNRGVVVGEYGDAYRHSLAFRWADGVLTPLTGPTDDSATADDINDTGTVVGHWYLRSPDGPWVYRDGQRANLPATPSGPRQGVSMPHAINACGVIAGQSGTADDPWFHAVLWRPGN